MAYNSFIGVRKILIIYKIGEIALCLVVSMSVTNILKILLDLFLQIQNPDNF